MKTILLRVALVLAFLVAVAPSVGADGVPEPRLITVTGDAVVRVVPNEIILTLGVETWDSILPVAKSQNDERVMKILKVAVDFGIPAKAVQTDYISVEPRYRYEYEKSSFVGYFVRKTIVITLTDPDKFEGFLSSVLTAGASHVHGIQFRTTDLRKYRDEARSLAIRAAREKAVAMAKELDQKIGLPYRIQEEPTGWWSWYNYGWWGSSTMGNMSQNVVQNASQSAPTLEDSIALGQITVEARVTVTFEMKE